ncbi:YjbH domain-containing protein [Halomonas sp. TRM85114]|uniref:YjbH domain-containing protein n=1 Tax=Halomonas jincaotanensis TaxID=2810616 RepID=UPI001BD558DC|nr:YjbH domain-containing protein [Halomonas jincaotanensis]MBS9404049.1 YjbH domain-containing protein [Halomonas jincaotanensis]
MNKTSSLAWLRPTPSPASSRWGPVLSCVLLSGAAASAQADGLAGELGAGQGDYGGVGLMQTPTARMAPEGTMSIAASRTDPYRRYSVFLQPLEWLEGGFRYVEIEDRLFGESIAGNRRYLDKGFDMKLRLLEENRYWPQLALGFRDVGGTTLFGAEYLVASKRWYDLDVSLGVGWGHLGNAADIDSPLGWASDRFDERPRRAGGDRGGEFAVDALFRGPVALFGGVEYQTPWEPLVLQLEYEGNDYGSEPLDNDQEQDSRFNVGARLALSDNLELRGGWQRGNTAMAGLTYNIDLAGLSQVKRDPEPASVDAPPREDWAEVARELEHNAGMRVARIEEDGVGLRVVAEPSTFRSLAQSEGRAGRILHAQADEDIERFHYQWQNRGMSLREDVHQRDAFVAAARSSEHEVRHRHGIYAHASLENGDETLYRGEPRRFDWRLGPRLDQNFGGPDGYLYRLMAVADAEYHTDPNGWFSGTLAWTLFDNLDRYDYRGPSQLPRVRTFIGDYLAESSLGIENLQYTRTGQLGEDWYAMGYGGLLEMMFAGAGGELLYRPFDSPIALGADVNWVRQRDFEQGFGLRDYDTWTGHLSAYVETGVEDILAKLSVGRYLAGDYGSTLDLSREFESGVRVGGWATWTDADDDFGEGGFDKGLYVSIPLDAFFTRSSRDKANISWRPLTRDGGAALQRRYSLYELTEERQLGRYWDDYAKTWE